MPLDSSVDFGQLRNHSDSWIVLLCFENFWIVLRCFEMFWAYMTYEHSTSYIIYIHYHSFTLFCILWHFADSKTIKQGLSAMGICVSGLLSGFRAVGGETSCRDPPASQPSCWCKQGSFLWWDVGRQMQTFWFFRGDRSGRSSDVSCPLILQWTLDNYETILINDVLWASAFYFLHFLLFFTYFCNILHYFTNFYNIYIF